jgi:RNA-directed DNA polymerase
VRKHGNLTRAWQAVSANSRHSTSPYVIDDARGFAGDEQRRIRSISTRLQRETYRFSPSRGVAIAKAGKPGQIRPIVISGVEDRIVQRCVLDALSADSNIQSEAFQPLSFGGIPKRDKDGLAGVPAAIDQLIKMIENGASHVMIADIEGFFTRISKSACLDMVRQFTDDEPFLRLLSGAVSVDLENAKSLWKHKDKFPYGDIGVAQGNCLSPFLGNLLLSNFDKKMNEGDCYCIRYIDDIIIVAPSGRAASSRMRLAQRLLHSLGMRFSESKTSPVPIPVTARFDYLGIEFSNQGLRPAKKSRSSIIRRCEEVAAKSLIEMKAAQDLQTFDQQYSVPKTLNRISGMAKGWAHHYNFCNDYQTIRSIDNLIGEAYLSYLEKAQRAAASKKPDLSAAILGFRGLADVQFAPFRWPTPPRPAPPSAPAAA